jgi:hypothetical protein
MERDDSKDQITKNQIDGIFQSLVWKPVYILRQPELPESDSGRNQPCFKWVKLQLFSDESTRITKWEASNKGW